MYSNKRFFYVSNTIYTVLMRIFLRFSFSSDGGSGFPAPAVSGGQDKLSGQDNPAFNPEIKEAVVNGCNSPDMDKIDTITKM